MDKKETQSEKFTTNINLSGVPVKTKEAIDNKADKLGVTTAGYIKNLINQDLKADKDRFEKAG